MAFETKTDEDEWERLKIKTSKTSQKNKTKTDINLTFQFVVNNGVNQLRVRENDGPMKEATFASLDKYKKEVISNLVQHYVNYSMTCVSSL